MRDEEDTTIYSVIINHEEQYSIWPERRSLPRGWKEVGKTGTRSEMIAHVKRVWGGKEPVRLDG